MARSKSPARRAAKSPGRTSGKNTVATEATWESTEGEGVWGCYVAPLLLLLPCPVLCYVLAYISSLKEPTLTAFKAEIDKEGLMVVLNKCFEACGMGDEKAWCFLFVFCFTSLLVYWWPGKVEYGPITPNGHIPEYMDNGVTHCVIFTTLFLAGSKEVNPLGPEYGWYNITIIWDTFNKTIGALNIFGLVFCLFLYYKGLHFPSGPDSGTNGKGFIFDYYWGAELYPRIFNVDVKKFVNDRFSMTYWMLAGISFAYKSKELHGVWDWGIIFCAASQFIYLFKFFWWEMGYMRSIDIIVDRAGFYETWGCLVWVPSVYTLHTRLMVNAPSELSFECALALFVLSLSGVGLNFWADSERQWFRESDGKVLVWGKKPRSIRATYTAPNVKTGKMETRTSLLLASGWWGVARHFQYMFELTAAYGWAMLSGCHSLLPFFYPVFLTILLVHRAKRDEEKCLAKYGDDYRKYMKMVPYKIIPGIY